MKTRTLSQRIYNFLENHANIRPDWDSWHDPEDEKYTSPDASILKTFADLLESKIVSSEPLFVSWESGGFSPYNSEDARIELEQILAEVKILQK